MSDPQSAGGAPDRPDRLDKADRPDGASPIAVVTRPQVQEVVLGAILVIFFILVCRLFAPFFTVLLWSILLYTLCCPFYLALIRNLKHNSIRGRITRSILAGIFSLGTVVLILIPLLFVASQFFRQITELIRVGRDFFSSNPVIFHDFFSNASDFISDITSGLVNIDPSEVQRQVVELLTMSLQRLLRFSSSVAINLGSFGIGMMFMMFCLYFFYMDGPYLSQLVLHIFPIRRDYTQTLVGKFKDITRNLFLGYIMVSLVQALMAYLIFTIFGVKGSLVFAALVLVCAFVPMFGAGLVWFPLGMIRLLSGNVLGGVVFLLVSGFFISLLDNFLRPMFLQNRIQLHPLFIFVSILGGVTIFGFNGLVLGPMIVILFLTVLDLFLTEHNINV
jgi:predicted PurR-regulated permease PerM